MGSQKYPKFCTQSEEQSKLLWSQDYHRPRFKKLTSWGLQRLSACQRLSSGSKAITKRRRPSLSQQVYLDWNTRVATVYAYIYIYIPCWELTYPQPRDIWRWFSFFCLVGYVSSMECSWSEVRIPQTKTGTQQNHRKQRTAFCMGKTVVDIEKISRKWQTLLWMFWSRWILHRIDGIIYIYTLFILWSGPSVLISYNARHKSILYIPGCPQPGTAIRRFQGRPNFNVWGRQRNVCVKPCGAQRTAASCGF